MSISNEALRKLLVDIEQKSIQSSQQMAIVKAQIAAKSREGRLLQLTSKELAALPRDTQVYEGVGKMFVLASTGDVLTRLGKEAQDLKADSSNLEKKLHYLETTYNNSKAQLDNFLRSSGPS